MDEIAKTLGIPAVVVTTGASAIAFLGRMLWKRIETREADYKAAIAEYKAEIAELKKELSKTSAMLLAELERQRRA